MTVKQTKLTLQNTSENDVEAYLTLGATPGCVQSIKDIPFVTNPTAGSALQGSFKLKAGTLVSYTPPQGTGFNGNFSFGTPPLNCPSTDFPSGVNLAEFILNNSFQGAGAQETFDISAVAGVNTLLKFSMTDGGLWNAGPTQPNVTEFENMLIGKNSGQVGIYPYACDVCTSSKNPPVCTTAPVGAPNPPIPQTEAICNVQRNASNSGGVVLLTFTGFVGVPVAA